MRRPWVLICWKIRSVEWRPDWPGTAKYTIAGPFELKQGGTGMLLFNPIYFMKEGKETFWGFSLLVINWENFIDEIELDKLEDVGYHYRIWKRTMSTGERFSIAQCQDGGLENTMEVACEEFT